MSMQTTNSGYLARENFRKYKGQWEKQGSTFVWELHYPDGHVKDGYSKNVGIPEKDDKKFVLKEALRRLVVNNKYLTKVSAIYFYRHYKDGSTKLLFILDRQNPHPQEIILDQAWLLEYLNSLYPITSTPQAEDLFPEPTYPENLVENELNKKEKVFPQKQPRVTEAEYFDSRRIFETMAELDCYCKNGKEKFNSEDSFIKYFKSQVLAYLRTRGKFLR